MGIIYALIPLSLLLALIALIAYVWAVKSGQFDDLDTPPLRMLYDDEEYKQGKVGEKN
jgi:cbb3-type cytochrome oxidase maturation protein